MSKESKESLEENFSGENYPLMGETELVNRRVQVGSEKNQIKLPAWELSKVISLEKENKELKEETELVKKENRELAKKLTTLSLENKELRELSKELRITYYRQESTINNLELLRQKLIKNNKALKEDNEALKTKGESCVTLGRLYASEAYNRNLTERLHKVKIENKELHETVWTLENKIDALEEKTYELKVKLMKEKPSELKDNKLSSELEPCGDRFEEFDPKEVK